MVIAIILFEAGSLMCALANDMNVLIGGRVLAGIEVRVSIVWFCYWV